MMDATASIYWPEALVVDAPLADNGYGSQANVVVCREAGIEPLLAMKREQHDMPLLERFVPDAPAPETSDPMAKTAHVPRTQAGRALHALHKQTVESVFGISKRVMGWHEMSMQGLAKAHGEWCLVTLARNIKRTHVLRVI